MRWGGMNLGRSARFAVQLIEAVVDKTFERPSTATDYGLMIPYEPGSCQAMFGIKRLRGQKGYGMSVKPLPRSG